MEKLNKEEVFDLLKNEDDFVFLKLITYGSVLGIFDEETLDKLLCIAIEKDDSTLICEIASLVEGIDIEKLEDRIIEQGNMATLQKFALNVEGANVSKLNDAIASISHKYKRR